MLMTGVAVPAVSVASVSVAVSAMAVTVAGVPLMPEAAERHGRETKDT